MATNSKSSRLAYLDWLRGLAALIMLQGHVFHSFTANELRNGGPYVLSQFVGGITPAIFLFLTGVTLAFLMESRERKGLPPGLRIWAGFRRAGYLLAVAFAFRLQLWLFAYPNLNPWTDIFRVDILNCMALAIGLMSLMAVFSTADRVRLCAILGLGIAAASPLVSSLDWSGVHPFVKGYLVPDYLFFSFFPWAAFVAFGISAGSVLRLVSADQLPKVMQWACLLGFGLVLGGQYFSNIPYSLYSKSEFWLDSPALIIIKLGVILLMLSFGYLWTEYASARRWSWLRILGTNSLLVYWVHIELVYGRWLGGWKENLDVTQTAIVAVATVALMVSLAASRPYWKNWRPYPALAGYRLLAPRRVSGD
jgi:uncharacterized membrane protein